MKHHKQKTKRTSSQPLLTPARKRAFFLITAALPFVLFLGLEIILRLFGYGPDLSLFTTEVIAGKTYHVMNPDVKARYFSRVEFNPGTSPDYFSVPKDTGVFRIFFLGGSTTVGYPYGYGGSFSSFLRDRLRKTFPEKRAEIINVGMTATNSFTVNDIAEELVEYEPDLLVVYDGHNEFYGALGVASHESAGYGRWLSKVYLKLVHFRVVQLAQHIFAAAASFFPQSYEPEQGTMMERLARGQYIPSGSKLYQQGLEIFRKNIDELKTLCVKNNIPLILSSQVSNLRDMPPFISGNSSGAILHRSDIPLHPDSAIVICRSLLANDSTEAITHYRLAKALDSLGHKSESEYEYKKARDFDMLRFRTSSDFNDVIRNTASEPEHVYVADLESVLRKYARDSIIGHDLILEHLHPNSRGYFLMAKEYAYVMKKHHLFATEDEWKSRDTIHDELLWKIKPLTEFDELCAQRRTSILISGWPFTQSGNSEDSPPKGELNEIVERVVKGKITWEAGHVTSAEYYARNDMPEKAESEYKVLINQIPLNVSAYLVLAQLYVKEQKLQEAKEMLTKSLSIEKTLFAYRTLGTMAMNDGDNARAIELLKEAVAIGKLSMEHAESAYLLALAFARNKQKDLAIMELRSLLTEQPRFKKANDLLQRLQREQ